MRGAIFAEFQKPITVENLPDPEPAADGVVVEVKASGICRSDWHGWMGHDQDIRLPHVPGHELAGVIVAAGSEVRNWKPGNRVTVPFSEGCGHCPQCQSGNEQVCDNYYQPGFTGWGSFAQYVAVRYADTNLVRLPEELSFVEAASLGCRFITAFRAVVMQGRVKPGEWVAVHGCGGLGLAAVMIANAMGANVVGVDIKPDALALARSLGAAQVVDGRESRNVFQAVRDLTHGGAHVSLDTLGSAETCGNSIRSLRKRGRHIQVGLMVADYRTPPVPMARVVAMELEIYGSHGMQAHAYEPMLQMILAGKLQPGKLVSKTVLLEQASAELQAMGNFAGTGVTVIDRF